MLYETIYSGPLVIKRSILPTKILFSSWRDKTRYTGIMEKVTVNQGIEERGMQQYKDEYKLVLLFLLEDILKMSIHSPVISISNRNVLS